MANGSLLGDIKSRFGIGNKNNDNANYDEGYDDYEEYDEYDEYDDYNDPYMDRNPVSTREERGASMPRLVTMDDARESVRGVASGARDISRSSSRGSSTRSYGRTMVDSSLPQSMTAEGTAAISAASNRRAEGLDSLFGGGPSSDPGSTAPMGNVNGNLIRNSMQLSMPSQRHLQIIKPKSYEDAEAVTNVLKSGDAAILTFDGVARDLMKRILDFSFGAASALDATVECIGNGVFAICRTSGLDDKERKDLRDMGVI